MPYLHKCMSRVSSVIDVYHLFFFSVSFPPCHLQASKWKDLAGPEWQLLSWQADALHICLSHFQRYQLRISFCVLQMFQTPFPPLLLFSVISSSLRILLRTMVLFELKLHCLEGPLSAGVMQCPDGSGTCRAMLGRCFSHPSSLWFVLTLCWVVWEKKKKKSYFVLMWWCYFLLLWFSFFFFLNFYFLWGQRKFLQLFTLFIAGI